MLPHAEQREILVAAAPKLEQLVTQDRVALEFACLHSERFRFCHSAGTWFVWDGTRWRRDAKQLAFHCVRELSRVLSSGGNDAAVREARKAGFVAGVERFARGDPALAASGDDWDSDPFLLGTPEGTVDLRTGEMHPSRQINMITKTTAVAPAATANCPRFLQFLDETFQGDAGVVRLIQQYLGYALTGDTSEHRFVFGEGKGGNGKGVLINTVMGLMQDYAAVVAMEALTASKHDRHPTEIAALRGMRLVTASETEGDREWAEARIKALTGGDRVKARFMRQDEFEFTPTFKLFVTGNNRPSLRNVDEAMKRRLIVVPFFNDVSKERRDPELPEKLKAEWPGILRWMIEGCLDWQANRLVCPEVVMVNTADYFDAQDMLGRFLQEQCDFEPGNTYKRVGSTELFQAWCAFAKLNGEEPGKQPGFVQQVKNRGAAQVRTATFRGISGIRLRQPPSWDAPQ